MTIWYDIRASAGEVDIYDWNGSYYETVPLPDEGYTVPDDLLDYLNAQFDAAIANNQTTVALRILRHAAFEDWEEGTP